MKPLPALEDRSWKPVCVQELHGLKKLKRKAKEPARRANGYKTFRLDLEAPEPSATAAATNGLRDRTQRLQPAPAPVPAPVAPAAPAAAGADLAGERRGARAPEVPDAQRRGFALGAVGPGLPTPPPPPPAPPCLAPGRPETQPFREPGVRPRILLCAPPARPTLSAPPASDAPTESSVRPSPPTRPGESSYSSISHVIYNNHPDSSASPRRRPGEATAASSEIKALQQTRRLLANARERTRVHTISAAFEALRKQVPCYSYGQKLSKLAILRIACNYILSLARLADLDYSADHSNLSFSECVQRCTRTLQAEGRAKKRKVRTSVQAAAAGSAEGVSGHGPTEDAAVASLQPGRGMRTVCHTSPSLHLLQDAISLPPAAATAGSPGAGASRPPRHLLSSPSCGNGHVVVSHFAAPWSRGRAQPSS
ncbi:transcription factor ATOH8 isoform X1 [Cavia porcellus]|uniref:transcription factor ATOH8 isoform X1 n=1 Tax=Cavia porcellus TaxID=10141 RepID=UPI002FE0067A